MNNSNMNLLQRLIFKLGKAKVKILLDLEGSIAPSGVIEEGRYRTFNSREYATWHVRNNVIEWLRAKRDDTRVELIWSSTWQEYANSILEESGIEPIEWVDFASTYQMPDDWYKKDGLKLLMQGKINPMVIVDNELPEHFLSMNNPRILCIKPESNAGISDLDLQRIDDFIERYRTRKISLIRS